MKRLEQNKIIKKGLFFYTKYGKYSAILFFFGGFTWDSLTLTRIDRLSDNIILLLYLLFLAFFIILVHLLDQKKVKNRFLKTYQDWYPLAIQFILGGLFSSYVVFYFKSASLSKTMIFVGILAILLIANEFLESRLKNIYLQLALFFLAGFSFFIFFVPVLLKTMSIFTFIFSGILSLIFVFGILYLLFKKFHTIEKQKLIRISGMVIALYLLINLLYVYNLIPPIPLSLEMGAIYHSVKRQNDQYELKFEKPEWYQFWKSSDSPFHYYEGDTVNCFVSIFAPTLLKKKIYHIWQWYNPETQNWLITDKLDYEIIGGRDGGYRGYTYKRNISPGEWRVNVVTEEELIIGRINFEIRNVPVKVGNFKTIFR